MDNQEPNEDDSISRKVKVLEYCKENNIPISKPVLHEEEYIYIIDMKDLTEEQMDYINNL